MGGDKERTESFKSDSEERKETTTTNGEEKAPGLVGKRPPSPFSMLRKGGAGRPPIQSLIT